MTKSITVLIDLGQGEQGEQRKQALLDLAAKNGHEWGGKPSIGKLIVALADVEIEKQKGENDELYNRS